MPWLRKLFILILLVFISFSCSKKDPVPAKAAISDIHEVPTAVKKPEEKITPVITKVAELAPVEAPEVRQAMITFISGEVFRLKAGKWVYAEIGESLEKNDSIRVGTDSFCEIQFSNRAVIRVAENTELALNTVNLNPAGAKIGIELVAGTVLSKVQKLADNDRFNVKTQSIACGVRGTEFSVTAKPGGDTVLAVKKGAVAILPPEIVVENLAERTGESGNLVSRVLKKIETAAFVVKKNEEISLPKETFENIKEPVKKITEIIGRIEKAKVKAKTNSSPVKEVPPKLVEDLTSASETISTAVTKPEGVVEEISARNIDKLESTENMRMLNIPAAVVPAVKGSDNTVETKVEEPTTTVSLHKFSLKIIPANAEIVLNSKIIGKGSFSGVFEEGDTLDFTFISNNFKTKSKKFTVSSKTSKEYTITLEKTKAEPENKEEKTPAIEEGKEKSQTIKKEETVAPVKEKVAETKENPVKKDAVLENGSIDKKRVETVPEAEKLINVNIRIVPSDSNLVVNGKRIRSNIFSGKFPEGTSINIKGSRNGFGDKSKILTVGEQSSNVTINLDPRPVESTLVVSEKKLVGSITTGANMIYTSDSKGLISAVSPEGRLVWSFASANNSVENSYPVFSNNRIYFSGSRELVILNALNGKVVERKALDKNSAHIFGRRLVPFGSEILFPANDEIRVLNGSSGKLIRTIDLPGSGSRMTPAVWNNKILSVDQNGTLSIINPDSGVVEKEIATSGSQPIALSLTIKNNLAVFSGRKGNVVCVDLNAGKVLWEKQLNGSGSKVQVYSDIVCSSTGAYVYTKGIIFGLNLSTGKGLFEPVRNVSAPPALINNELVFGNTDAKLLFMDSVGGNIRKSLVLDNDVTTRPAELNGKICVGIYPGKVVIVNPEGIR